MCESIEDKFIKYKGKLVMIYTEDKFMEANEFKGVVARTNKDYLTLITKAHASRGETEGDIEVSMGTIVDIPLYCIKKIVHIF